MIIRELLWDYDYTQSKELADYQNCIQTKKLSDAFNDVINNFITACHSKVWEPKSLMKEYRTQFDQLEKMYKDTILENKRAKSGMFIWSSDGMDLDQYIKDTYNFTVTKTNTVMNYSADKLYDLSLYEVSMLYHKYNKLYEFQIRYAIVKILCNRFNLINQAAELFGTGYDTISYNVNDIDDILTRILNTEVAQLACFTPTLLDSIVKVKNNRKKVVVVTKKPTCKEDLLVLIDDSMSQKEKKLKIATYYSCQQRTAQTYMKKFGLLQESNADKHFRKLQEQHGEIISEVQKSKDEIIAELKKDNKILHDKIDILEKKIDLLLKRNEELEQKLFYALSNKNDYMREVKSNSSSGLNFGNLENMIF